MVSVKITDAQDIAFNVLWRVEYEDAYASPVLNAVLKNLQNSNQIKAVATQIIYGTLRWKGYVQYIISKFTNKPWDKTDKVTRLILLIAGYQILKTDLNSKTVVYKSVEQAKLTRGEKVGAFVNAILRKLTNNKEKITNESVILSKHEDISIYSSHPEWIVKKLINDIGIDETVNFCNSNNIERPILIRINSLIASRDEVYKYLADKLGEEKVIKTNFSPYGIKIISNINSEFLQKYNEGYFTYQDEGAQIIPLLLNPQPDDIILDATAGRGGKTTLLASFLGKNGIIDAADKYPSKLKQLNEELKRLKIESSVNLIGVDLEIGMHGLRNEYDKILLDSPCTGSGTFRSKPELRWKLTENDINRMSDIQFRLLKNISTLLKPGGLIVYAVCSIFKQERWDVIEKFLDTSKQFSTVKASDINPYIFDDQIIDEKGALNLWPQKHETDGFYAVVLKKSSVSS